MLTASEPTRSRPPEQQASASSGQAPEPRAAGGRIQSDAWDGLDGAVDAVEELAAHRVEVDGLAQVGCERGDDRLGVVAGTVEATVDESLHTLPQRVEQRGGRQRRSCDGNRGRERQDVGRERDDPDEDDGEQSGLERAVMALTSPFELTTRCRSVNACESSAAFEMRKTTATTA